jgi:hypothetical protein
MGREVGMGTSMGVMGGSIVEILPILGIFARRTRIVRRDGVVDPTE